MTSSNPAIAAETSSDPARLAIGSVITPRTPDCFGCGGQEYGLAMELTVERKLAVTGRFQVTEAHQGAPGVAHGGILSAAFDEAMGAIAWYLLEPAVTVQLNVAYRAPVPVGSDVTVRAHLVHEEGRKLFVRGVAELADGHEVAEADGIFVKVPVSHFAAAVEPRAAEGDINTFSGEPQARA